MEWLEASQREFAMTSSRIIDRLSNETVLRIAPPPAMA